MQYRGTNTISLVAMVFTLVLTTFSDVHVKRFSSKRNSHGSSNDQFTTLTDGPIK